MADQFLGFDLSTQQLKGKLVAPLPEPTTVPPTAYLLLFSLGLTLPLCVS